MKDFTKEQRTRSDAACRHLAVRVIHQAFRDLSGAVGSCADRESARTFLSGSPMLYRWCEVANLDAAWTVCRATKLMAQSGQLAVPTVIQDDFVKQARILGRRREGNQSRRSTDESHAVHDSSQRIHVS